uniref:Major facilitator superfamily (MFS) profile domain-containing protein n=1 Tax=Phlebotomus papatasi TaxID=29031 RepID=A0A1B0DRA6_PHLPP
MCALLGCLVLFFVDLHRRSLSRHKHTRANGTRHLCTSDSCPQRRKLSFSQEPDHEPGVLVTGATLMIGSELLIPQLTDKFLEPAAEKPELTCISEEGIADMDLPDNLLDDLDYVGDCITSCNKVENFLMLSEFENNLNAELPALLERKRRRVSISMNKNAKISEADEETTSNGGDKSLNIDCLEPPSITNSHRHHKLWHPPANAITVIDEASSATVVGIGVGMTRDCSTLMVAQYFKRRREFVEIFIVAGSGLGITVMSAFIKSTIDSIGWRLGLQAVTGVVFLTFILGTFYRSASLYHPQRRAILHLKNQRRKIKDKNKQDDSPPFFDFRTLRSKTVRILLVSTAISGFGINTPIYYLAHQMEQDGIGDRIVVLQAYLGLAFMLGCGAFGMLVVRNSVECRIARQYLCQTSVFMCGISILAFTAVHGNYHGYVMFVWIYGIFCGGYHYSLKMYTYERVRARNFARTWGFVQFSQA